MVGTTNYIAPEVFLGTGYDHTCDWWSLGVILFECIYGYPPFCSKTQQQSKQKILNWKRALFFPDEPPCSSECRDLMSKLLCEPQRRLGSGFKKAHSYDNSTSGIVKRMMQKDGDADDIKSHPWFAGIDWDSLHQSPAPFVPDLENIADASYFDQVDEAEIRRMMEGSLSGVRPGEQANDNKFEGFSYMNPSILRKE